VTPKKQTLNQQASTAVAAFHVDMQGFKRLEQMMSRDPAKASTDRLGSRKLSPVSRSWRSTLGGAYGQSKFKTEIDTYRGRH